MLKVLRSLIAHYWWSDTSYFKAFYLFTYFWFSENYFWNQITGIHGLTNIWKPTTIALIIQKMIDFPTAGQLTRKNWLNNNTSILSEMPFTHLLMLYTIYMLKVAILSNPRTDFARNSSKRSSRIWSLNFSKLISQVSNWYWEKFVKLNLHRLIMKLIWN